VSFTDELDKVYSPSRREEWDYIVECFPKAVVPDKLLMKYEASRASVDGWSQSRVTDDNLATR
jgi:hypothetical protein